MTQFFANGLVHSLLLGGCLALQPAFSWATEYNAGEFMIVGFKGQSLQQEQREHFRSLRPQGYILFSRNISDPQATAQLIKDIGKLNSPSRSPLFAVDQEGGLVQRVKGWVTLPSARAIGQSGDPALTYQLGVETGKILKSLGINMNLAPVLDLGQPASSDFMRSRTFGRAPSSVSEHGVQFSKGLLSQGVLPVAKHFPGLGKAKSDPHLSTPLVRLSPLEWSSKLEPFKDFASISPSGMMVSHAIYSPQDPTGHPATFSSYINKTLLRSEIKFEGIVVTDDLLMAGATQHRDLGKAAVDALKAGADLVLVSWGLKQQRLISRAIDAAITSGEISKEELEKKRRRISQTIAALGLAGRGPAALSMPQFQTQKLSALVEESYKKSIARLLMNQHPSKVPNVYCEKVATCDWIRANTKAKIVSKLSGSLDYAYVAESFDAATYAISRANKPKVIIFMSHNELAHNSDIPVINLYGRQKTGLKVSIEALMKGPYLH